jgi:hypothetical protein
MDKLRGKMLALVSKPSNPPVGGFIKPTCSRLPVKAGRGVQLPISQAQVTAETRCPALRPSKNNGGVEKHQF